MLVLLLALLSAIDFNGKSVQLFDKPTVLIFVRSDCPISNRYAPELQRVYREFSPRAAFYLVYPDRAETAESIRKHVAEYSYPFDALRDPDRSLVKRSKVHVTPEVAVFAPGGELVYHGRIDDRYVDFGKSRQEPTTHELEDALQAVLAGKPVKVASTRAIGCFLADVK